MLDYEFHSRTMFSISKVPRDAMWDDGWVPQTLTFKGCPVGVRVVGTVVSVDEDGKDDEGRKMSLALELTREVDHQELVRLLKYGGGEKGV